MAAARPLSVSDSSVHFLSIQLHSLGQQMSDGAQSLLMQLFSKLLCDSMCLLMQAPAVISQPRPGLVKT